MRQARIARLLVSLTLFGGIIYVLDWHKLIFSLQKIDLSIFIVAVIVSSLNFVVLALRWHQIISPYAPLPLVEHLRLYFYGTFLNAFTPANIGGDIYRFCAIRSPVLGHISVMMALIQERLLGLLAYFAVFLLCLVGLWLLQPGSIAQAQGLFMYAGAMILAGTAGILMSPYIFNYIARLDAVRSRDRLVTILTSLHDATHFASPAGFAQLLSLSLLGLMIWIIAVWIVALDLGIDMPWLTLSVTVILVELIRLVPVSIQGIGVREGMYAYVFALLGESPEAGFALGTVSYLALSFALCLSGLAGWGLMWFLPPKIDSQKDVREAQ